MKNNFFLLAITWICLLAACSKEEAEPALSITTPQENMILNPKKGAELIIEFTSTLEWKVSTDANWVTIGANSGAGGNHTILITADQDNETGNVRTGNLTFQSGHLSKTIQFNQSSAEVLRIDKAEFKIISEGKDIKITFATTLPFESLRLYSSEGANKWIEIIQPKAKTRALETGNINLRISENKSQSMRKAVFKIVSVDANENPVMESELISISQDGVPVETSTDFSQDGKWRILQKHTIGRGIPLVIVGDGFVDKEIASGFYDEVMEKACENFFTEEPIRSLRSYFDIWTVTAVSKHNSFADMYSTVFECKLEGGNSTGITGNHATVVKYIQSVDDMRSLEKLEEATVIVVLNSSAYAGTTYWGFGFREERPMSELSIGYCPIIDGSLDSEHFRRVLCHECIGHGFGKLLDEYSYQSSGAIPANLVANYKEYQKLLGWALNVDFTPNLVEINWKHFLDDNRYKGTDAVGQTLGAYQGACTFWTGAWRPTEESMMRNNINGFNAPSREVIYKRVMGIANGIEWEYDYEEFVRFDQAHLPALPLRTKGTENPSIPFEQVRIANQMLKLK